MPLIAEASQLDWISLEDHRAAASRMLVQACERIGVGELAHKLGEDTSTVVHQLKRDGSKRPSGDLVLLALLLDREFRQRFVGLLGESLTKPPDMTAEDVVRELYTRAQAQGGVLRAEMADLIARMGRKPAEVEDAAPVRSIGGTRP